MVSEYATKKAIPNGSKMAFPSDDSNGLTKREYFALHIFNGLVHSSLEHTNYEQIIPMAINGADRLLDALGGAKIHN